MDESGGIEPNHRDVTLYYDIIDSNETVVDRYRCHVCSSNILKSYKSLLFSIESYRIPQGRSIRIEFSYEWENKLFVEQGIEPKHFVFFNLADEGITNDRPR